MPPDARFRWASLWAPINPCSLLSQANKCAVFSTTLRKEPPACLRLYNRQRFREGGDAQ